MSRKSYANTLELNKWTCSLTSLLESDKISVLVARRGLSRGDKMTAEFRGDAWIGPTVLYHITPNLDFSPITIYIPIHIITYIHKRPTP